MSKLAFQIKSGGAGLALSTAVLAIQEWQAVYEISGNLRIGGLNGFCQTCPPGWSLPARDGQQRAFPRTLNQKVIRLAVEGAIGRVRTRFTLTILNDRGDTELYSYSALIPVETTLFLDLTVEGAAQRIYNRIPIVDLITKAYYPLGDVNQ